MPTPMPFPDLARFLKDHLLNFVMPFWMKHAIDPQGGINTCINDNGTLNSTDKLLWSQLRAIWTFSALYNRIDRRQEWLDVATNIFQFCAEHGRNEQGNWVFRLNREGRQVEGDISIYVDGFALMGLSEYFTATKNSQAKRLAMETFENVQRRVAKPGSYRTYPYDIPAGMKAHGISMIFARAFDELAIATGDARIDSAALEQAEQVMNHFRRPERQALLEYVNLDGTPDYSTPIGRCVVPGHAIESMWFLIQLFERHGMSNRLPDCIECIRWHIERGWDREFGGIFLGVDLENKTPIYWKFHDTKVWWQHTEALYALLKAHALTGEPWCLDWYWKVHDVSFQHYPVPEHGEWTQKLDRRFNKITDVVALPVKDPFHLPRALIMCIQLLEQS
jgi:N-acylglucosamine 2-epimerase